MSHEQEAISLKYTCDHCGHQVSITAKTHLAARRLLHDQFQWGKRRIKDEGGVFVSDECYHCRARRQRVGQ